MAAIKLGDQSYSQILLAIGLEVEAVGAHCPIGCLVVGDSQLAEDGLGVSEQLLEERVFHEARGYPTAPGAKLGALQRKPGEKVVVGPVPAVSR